MNNSYTLIDPYMSNNIDPFLNLCKENKIHATFIEDSDIKCKVISTDLLFIDTWHVYGHLKRELDIWHSSTRKYIIMHDTTIYEYVSEVIHGGRDPQRESIESGLSVDEVSKGLWPAVEEFLQSHPEWRLEQRFMYNNGLTILSRI
jgi:hypothetical protein